MTDFPAATVAFAAMTRDELEVPRESAVPDFGAGPVSVT